MDKLTLAVVTKKRPDKLERCLKSILEQKVLPNDILIIDNDSAKSAYRIFERFNKKYHLRYVSEKKPGVSNARNKAIISANTKYLGFVDDDCILKKNWTEEAMKPFKKNGRLGFAVGKTLLFNSKNILASAQHLHDWYWFIRKIRSDKQISPGSFDTKNLLLNRDMVTKKGLRFDPKCSLGGFDSADLDFGLQLDNEKIGGIYNKEMKIFHDETTTIKRFIKRAYYRGKITHYIENKWRLNEKLVTLPGSSMLVWLRRKFRKIPSDLNKYASGAKTNLTFKFLVTVAIIISEGAYIKGYQDFEIKS